MREVNENIALFERWTASQKDTCLY